MRKVDTLLDAGNGPDIVVLPPVEPVEFLYLRLVGHGDEDLRLEEFLGAVKAWRSDTDDCVGQLVETDSLADDGRVTVEVVIPRAP